MAQIREVRLVDDLDGSVATETVELSLDGTSYEIDLNDTNGAVLRDALAPFIAAARRAGRPTAAPRRSGARRPREELAEIREWARSQGLTVSDRGRLPAEVLDAFAARHSEVPAPVPVPVQEEAPPKRAKKARKMKAEEAPLSSEPEPKADAN